MIKINLIPQRKPKRSDKGQRNIGIGMGAVIASAALTYLLIHLPMVDEIETRQADNAKLKADNASISAQTSGLAAMQAAVKAAQDQDAAIERLNASRAVPAWMLWELSNILTSGKSPSITPEMKKELETNPNRRLQPSWDPKHVWITRFEEKGGNFKMEGGAQSDTDMTQLALRLQASMYFDDVLPEGGGEVKATQGGTGSYYKFVLTGRVKY